MSPLLLSLLIHLPPLHAPLIPMTTPLLEHVSIPPSRDHLYRSYIPHHAVYLLFFFFQAEDGLPHRSPPRGPPAVYPLPSQSYY